MTCDRSVVFSVYSNFSTHKPKPENSMEKKQYKSDLKQKKYNFCFSSILFFYLRNHKELGQICFMNTWCIFHKDIIKTLSKSHVKERFKISVLVTSWHCYNILKTTRAIYFKFFWHNGTSKWKFHKQHKRKKSSKLAEQ